MRYVSFAHDGVVRPGILEGERIRAIASSTLREFIALEAEEQQAAITQHLFALDAVRFDVPVRPSRNLFCVGRNYLGHAKEGARAAGRELKLPSNPTFFTKAPSTLVAHDGEVHLQADVSDEYDFEAELAVVIGRHCKNIAEADALGVVFGYTCANDITARDLQRAHGEWFKGKSLDHTCPLGPWIVGAQALAAPQDLPIAFRLNGEPKQASRTSEMIFSIARIISELSRGMALVPGDIILTGTPDGVGFARTPPEFLRDGDQMEVEIQGVGTLRNRVRIA